MKIIKIFAFLAPMLITSGMYSQTGLGTSTPNPSSVLHLKSTTKGFLKPSMTSVERIAILAPAEGLEVFDTTTKSTWYFNGTVWVNPPTAAITYTGSTSVGLNGTSFERAALTGDVTAAANVNATTIADNAVTSAKILDGTIGNDDLSNGSGGIYKGSGSLSGATTVTGGANTLAFTSTAINGFSVDETTLSVDAVNNRVGIGIDTPGRSLEIVEPGPVKTSSIMRIRTVTNGIDENYGIQFRNAGGAYFGYIGGNPNSISQGPAIVAGSGKAFTVYTGYAKAGQEIDPTDVSNLPRLTIKDDGRVGIGTSSPLEKLDVDGSVKFSGVLMPGGTPGVAGQVLTSSGVASAPVWVTQNSTAVTNGDVKNSLLLGDHSGWIKLDGRLISTLTTTQQAAATALGIGANLPDATNSYLVQNGSALGSISGSNNKIIAQNNLPNITLSGDTNVGGVHSHTYSRTEGATDANAAPFPASNNDAIFNLRTTSSDGAHSHTVVTSSINGGVTQQSFDVTPRGLSVNTFIYLGN